MTTLSRLPLFVVCGCLTGLPFAHADPPAYTDAVIDWNAISVQATLTAIAGGRPSQGTLLDMAMVHAAVYDAVQAIEGEFEPYQVVIDGASGSPQAAAAKAAHDVLVHLYAGQTAALDTTYHTYLQSKGLAEDDPGVAVGATAAAGIIAFRANDGSFPANPPIFTGGTGPGVWRPTISYLPGPPPSLAPMAVAWLGTVTPFALTSPTQFRAPRPPRLTSERYVRAYDEVMAFGSFSSVARTPEQTDIAYFFADNYLVLWNRAARDIAATHVHTIADSARLFALLNMSTADAVITAWDSKRHYVFWRPVTAIQEGDHDGNRRTVGDPDWRPLINTPNYPDYTSGANNVTGAATRALKLFFGTDWLTFTLNTGNPLAVQKARTYDRFSDAAADVVVARIYEGIHFRFADVEARHQGRLVASWVFKHFLRPVDDGDDGHDHDEDDDGDRGDDGGGRN
jgi:hypothetical protein